MQTKVEICGVNTSGLPVLSAQETDELLRRASGGDKNAREQLIQGNLRLVLSVVQRFHGKGESPDDLFQVGCIGLMKSIDHFNTELGVRFSTYAVPMIIFCRKNNRRRNFVMLFCNIDYLDEQFTLQRGQYIGVKENMITYIGATAPQEDYGEHYDGKNRLLLPGFFNVHSHAPMTLLRGYAENLPLSRWLNEKVFPFEDKLTDESVYWGTQLAIAEMLAAGIVSFSDMYFFLDGMTKAILDSGIKCNLSRGITAFDDSDYDDKFPAYQDNLRLLGEWQGANHGKLVGDLCIHGEYTSTPKIVKAVAAQAKEKNVRMHIHLSETQSEHEECKQRHGMTPAAYMESCGIFDVPTTAAHCVWLEGEDFDILARHGVTVACCPASNLKLGSGYAPIPKLLEKGVSVALGTDGAASNNNLNILKDIYLFAIAYKGFYHDSTLITPEQALFAATRAGALSQGRTDSGMISVGSRADLCVLNTDTPQFTPMTNVACNVVYAAQGADVKLTMVDGEVLYRDGAYTTIDIERVRAEVQSHTDKIRAALGE